MPSSQVPAWTLVEVDSRTLSWYPACILLMSNVQELGLIIHQFHRVENEVIQKGAEFRIVLHHFQLSLLNLFLNLFQGWRRNVVLRKNSN